METQPTTPKYKNHRFPVEIISHAVWLYFRFCLSFRAQQFLSAYGPIAQHFRPRRHRLAAPAYRKEMRKSFQSWREITSPALAAWENKL